MTQKVATERKMKLRRKTTSDLELAAKNGGLTHFVTNDLNTNLKNSVERGSVTCDLVIEWAFNTRNNNWEIAGL